MRVVADTEKRGGEVGGREREKAVAGLCGMRRRNRVRRSDEGCVGCAKDVYKQECTIQYLHRRQRSVSSVHVSRVGRIELLRRDGAWGARRNTLRLAQMVFQDYRVAVSKINRSGVVCEHCSIVIGEMRHSSRGMKDPGVL